MKAFLVALGIGLALAAPCTAQEAAEEDTIVSKGIVIHADPRLAVLLRKQPPAPAPGSGSGPRRGSIHSARGYRIQIYAGNDRVKAMKAKIDFAQRFPRVRTYLSYSAPQFKVKAGDFASRADAARMQNQASDYFSPVMIVPDIIVVNTLRNDY